MGGGIFLAGPTPRENTGSPSWQAEALRLLQDYLGNVFVPEGRGFQYSGNYDGQVYWELKALDLADIVLFWVPRDLDKLPGFTTNVEFGLVCGWEKAAVLGYPLGAPKTKYLRYLAETMGYTICHTLERTVEGTLEHFLF